jgi:methanethiol oxidase
LDIECCHEGQTISLELLERVASPFAYDDVAITPEWATPSMIENGLNPEDLLGRRFGHHLDFWSLSEGRLIQRVDLGDEHQMVLELRPAHDPRKTWGFVGVVISVADLSASVWLWHRDGDRWAAKKVITIPAEPAEASKLPSALQPFGFRGLRVHQTRLQGGDASSDSYCFVE